MIRPEEEGPSGNRPVPQTEREPAVQDFWAYVQDERQRYPHLWRVIVRIHTRAFRLAYPEYSLRDVWKLGDVILPEVVAAIESIAGSGVESMPDRFHLQMPIFPVERQMPGFSGTWRGWLSIGTPEQVY